MKHYASISELKRVFMEVKQDFGPTEWERRLSSYSPTAKTQLLHANEEIPCENGLSKLHTLTNNLHHGSQPGAPISLLLRV